MEEVRSYAHCGQQADGMTHMLLTRYRINIGCWLRECSLPTAPVYAMAGKTCRWRTSTGICDWHCVRRQTTLLFDCTEPVGRGPSAKQRACMPVKCTLPPLNAQIEQCGVHRTMPYCTLSRRTQQYCAAMLYLYCCSTLRRARSWCSSQRGGWCGQMRCRSWSPRSECDLIVQGSVFMSSYFQDSCTVHSGSSGCVLWTLLQALYHLLLLQHGWSAVAQLL